MPGRSSKAANERSTPDDPCRPDWILPGIVASRDARGSSSRVALLRLASNRAAVRLGAMLINSAAPEPDANESRLQLHATVLQRDAAATIPWGQYSPRPESGLFRWVSSILSDLSRKARTQFGGPFLRHKKTPWPPDNVARGNNRNKDLAFQRRNFSTRMKNARLQMSGPFMGFKQPWCWPRNKLRPLF